MYNFLVKDNKERIHACPPYSPELNPIEAMWGKIKSSLRKASARTLDKFEAAIKTAFESIQAVDQRKLFHAAQTLAQRGVNVFQEILLQGERSPEKVIHEIAKISGVEIKEQEKNKIEKVEKGAPAILEVKTGNTEQELENVLTTYLKKHTEFLHLVQQKIEYMGEDETLCKKYAKESVALRKEIHQFAIDALKNPVIWGAQRKKAAWPYS